MGRRPPSDLQRQVLGALLAEGSMTPNEIGGYLGLKTVHGGRGGGGRGQGPRSFGLAHRIIAPLNGLYGRGLVSRHGRADGQSGTEYSLTPEGRRAAEAHKAQRESK
jgi:hypothetical protein